MTARNEEQAEDFRIAIQQRNAALADAATLRDEVAHYRGLANEAANDALALRERVTRAEALLREMVDGTGTPAARGCVFCRAGAFLATTEPDGAIGTKETR